jgi:hypothetical protein
MIYSQLWFRGEIASRMQPAGCLHFPAPTMCLLLFFPGSVHPMQPVIVATVVHPQRLFIFYTLGVMGEANLKYTYDL